MELSPAQRKLAFAVVVFVLAGLGAYLLTSARHQARHPGAAPGGHPRHATSTPPATSPLPTASASSTPTGSSSPVSTKIPDIYQWLPFTKSGLADAATTAVKFGDAYGTFSYTEKAAAYVATMHGFISDQLAAQLSAAYSAPGVASLRSSRKQVSAGTAAITSLRAFGPNSLTFVLSVTERITATRDGGTTTTSYAVTLTGGDSKWQVSDIELASAGNF
jgi:hypothetical protein